MKFIKTDPTASIQILRTQLYQSLTAPIDAMWELLYIASAQHYTIENDNNQIGYCCIDEKGSLLQIYLVDEFRAQMLKTIETLIDENLITSASLSSNEPIAFNACLTLSESMKPNTYCFQHSNLPIETDSSLNIEAVSQTDIPAIKEFFREQIGMDDTFGYTQNLVDRKEIFMVKEGKGIIATSECRLSDTQPEIADLGIIVHKDFQGKGISTQIFQLQVNRVLALNRRPICSTTADNIASQKMIAKAGFYCSTIIFDLSFAKN